MYHMDTLSTFPGAPWGAMVARISSCYKTTGRIVQQTFTYVITCIRLRSEEPDTGIDCLSFFAHPGE